MMNEDSSFNRNTDEMMRNFEVSTKNSSEFSSKLIHSRMSFLTLAVCNFDPFPQKHGRSMQTWKTADFFRKNCICIFLSILAYFDAYLHILMHA